MNWLRELARRLRMLMHRRQFDTDLEEEMRLHLELRQQQQVECGMAPDDARAAARRGFGNVTSLKEKSHLAWGWEWFEQLVQDVRYGLRMLGKSSGFTAVAVLTLALGIGANTLIFSLAYAVLLRPLPYPSPEKILTLCESNPSQSSPQGQVSAANFYDWEAGSKVFSAMSAYSGWRFNLTGVPQPENVSGALVTPDFFAVLGVTPEQGRIFRHDEDQPGKDEVAVVSQSLWNRVFGAGAALSGQTVTLNQGVFTVVGILPVDFGFPSRTTEVWVPLDLSAENKQNRDGRWLTVIARAKSDATPRQVTSDLNLIAARLAAAYPKADANVGIRAISLHEYLVGETRPTFVVLLGAVGLLLLLACANVASLVFARGSGRAGEFALRYAIGAARGRIIRQLLTEGALLVAIGASTGLLVARWGVQWIRSQTIEGVPRIHEVKIDLPIVIFAMAVSLFVIALVGLLPAFRNSSYDSIKDSTIRLASNPSVQRQRTALVIAQIALAFILLVGASLLASSFRHLVRMNTGLQVSDRLSFQVSLLRSIYKTNAQQIGFFSQVLDRIAQQNSVLAAGGVSDLPLVGNRMSFKVLLEKPEVIDTQTPPQVGVRWTTPGYFDAIGMSLRLGRGFSAQDSSDSLPVAVVNQSMAQRFWPSREPIGMRVRLEEDPRWFTIVGVVGDIKQEALETDEGPALYVAYAQKTELWLNWMSVVVHSTADPRGLASIAREQIRSVDKDQPITKVATLEEDLTNLQMVPKLRMIVMGSFSSMAFCLAIVGIFGMISCSVVQRSHEIGIRTALGAQPWDIVRQFLGHGLSCILAGLALGLSGAWLLTRLLKSLLFGVDSLDARTFLLVAAVLFIVALAACWLPARRATRVDAITALRYE